MFGRKERKFAFKREPITELEDLRDDCIAVFLNSGLTMKAIHEKGGPTPHTTSKWLYRETRFPRMDSVRSMLQACDYELTIKPLAEVEVEMISERNPERRLRMSTYTTKMPRRKAKRKTK
jgi:hypothetical protein